MRTIQLSILSATIISCFSLFADEFTINNSDMSKVDKESWDCEYCITPEKISGQWSVAANYQTNHENYFRNRQDFDNKGNINASFDLAFHNENNTYAQVWFTGVDGNPMQPGLNLGARLGYYEGLQFDINYLENTHYYGNNSQSPYLNKGSKSVTLPDTWQFANNTQNMDLSNQDLSNLNVKLKRETLLLAFEYSNDSPWQPSISLSQEKKKGVEIKSGLINYHAAFLPTPISYTTNTLNTNISYMANHFLFDVSYHYSDFNNDKNELSWQSPYQIVNDDIYSLTPDSIFQRVAFTTRYKTQKTQYAAKGSFSQSKQDDNFVEQITVNGINSLNGKIDTTTLTLQASHRFAPSLRMTAKVNYLDRDNKTNSFIINGLENRVNDYKKTKAELNWQYKGLKPVNMKAGVKTIERKQPQTERTRTTENIAWLSLADRKVAWADLSIKYLYSERDGSKFKTIESSKNPQNPLLRRYHLADRRQDRVKGNIAFSIGQYFDTEANVYFAKDDYYKTDVGLQDGRDKGGDITFLGHVQQFNWQVFVAYHNKKYNRAGATNGQLANYSGITKNTSNQIGFNLELPQVKDQLYSAGFNYNYIRGTVNERTDQGRIVVTNDYSESKYYEHSADLYINYMLSEKSTLKAQVIYERNKDLDIFYQNADMDTLSNVLTNGLLGHNYQTLFFQLSYHKTL